MLSLPTLRGKEDMEDTVTKEAIAKNEREFGHNFSSMAMGCC